MVIALQMLIFEPFGFANPKGQITGLFVVIMLSHLHNNHSDDFFFYTIYYAVFSIDMS